MERAYSFVIAEGKSKSESYVALNTRKRQVYESDKGVLFIGQPQYFDTVDGGIWYAYQQYTFETDVKTTIEGSEHYTKAEKLAEGNGNSFFLCCCDLNNRIRLIRAVEKNVEIVGVPEFKKPEKNGQKWKVSQMYTFEPYSYEKK